MALSTQETVSRGLRLLKRSGWYAPTLRCFEDVNVEVWLEDTASPLRGFFAVNRGNGMGRGVTSSAPKAKRVSSKVTRSVDETRHVNALAQRSILKADGRSRAAWTLRPGQPLPLHWLVPQALIDPPTPIHTATYLSYQ